MWEGGGAWQRHPHLHILMVAGMHLGPGPTWLDQSVAAWLLDEEAGPACLPVASSSCWCAHGGRVAVSCLCRRSEALCLLTTMMMDFGGSPPGRDAPLVLQIEGMMW